MGWVGWEGGRRAAGRGWGGRRPKLHTDTLEQLWPPGVATQWQQYQVMAPQLVPSTGTILLTVTS